MDPAHAVGARATSGSCRLNGDGSRPSELAPEAYRLLEAFQWEWVRVYEHGDNESLGEWDAAGWLEAYKHPTFPVHQWRDGRRRKAAEALATQVQARIHCGPEPFDRKEAVLLDLARGLYARAVRARPPQLATREAG